MMNKKHIAVAFLALFLPFIALAFESGGVPNAAPNLDINSIIDVLFATMWPIIVAILILVFVGIGFLFLNAQGDPSKIASARLALIGGVVIVVIVLLAFSIPFIVRNTLGNNI